MAGRTNSTVIGEVIKQITNCYHSLSSNGSENNNSFENNSAKKIRLVKANIKYADGSSSNNVAVFQGGDLLNDGPLQPIAAVMMKISNDKNNQKRRKKIIKSMM